LDPELDPDQDPSVTVRGKDPRIRIRTRMSRIPNTDMRIRTKAPDLLPFLYVLFRIGGNGFHGQLDAKYNI
jgi:hypothetical protein